MLNQATKIIGGLKNRLLLRPNRKIVDVDEIPKRLRSLSYGELDELADFGSTMIQELVRRIPQLETKAAIIFGYSGALIAFLVSALRWWPESALLKIGFVGVGLCSAIAAVLAARALALKGGWDWPSEQDWFPEKAFGNLHAMKRRHLDALLNAHQTQSYVADRKAVDVLWAQRFLFSATVLLVAFFIIAVWFVPLKNTVGIST